MATAALPAQSQQHPVLALFDAARKRLEGRAGRLRPDPITFIVAPEYLNRPNLYPRQATLVKVIFLREDLFTDYDYEVVAEWEEQFRKTGNNGICPNILERMRLLKSQGYPWFREVLLVLGRRGGKGYITALCMAYVLWTYMSFGDPQDQFGVDRDKKLTLMCFAAKRDQAKVNVWTDINNVILGSTCFAPYIGKALGESLSIKAPNDDNRAQDLVDKGIVSAADMSSFTIVPKESTLTAGRGPASFAQCLDPSTPILTSDLRWVPIGNLKDGDHVIGVDEYPVSKGSHRKMRDAEVLRVWHSTKTAMRITFDDDSSVVCSPDHQWLFKDFGIGGNYLWRESSKLTVGSRIRHVVDPWEFDDSRDGGYLAGIYDGEGCVIGREGGGKHLSVSQNGGAVLDDTLIILRAKGYDPTRSSMVGRVCQQWGLDTVDSMRLLGSTRPTRLLPKAFDIWDGAALRKGKTPHGRIRRDAFKTITAIEALPEQELVDISTTTRTFIANGLVSHNCYDEMAHVVNSGSNRSAEDVYAAATPSLDQFGKYAIIFEPSSPWQMMGQFYDNYQNSILLEDGKPVYPEMLMLQLTSWDIYVDWEKAHLIPLLPQGFRGDMNEYYYPAAYTVEYAKGPLDPNCDRPRKAYPRLKQLRGAIQAYDDQMARLERSNPETFKVERRCLDPETRVLTADLEWIPIKDLKPGDALIGIDEENTTPSGQRKMRTTRVVAKEVSRDISYRLDFNDGSHVVCSANHRWLSSSSGSKANYRWRSISSPPGKPGPKTALKVGDQIRALVDPWGEDVSWKAGYLAGVYDGEGTIVCRARSEFRLDFTQNPGLVLDNTLEYLRDLGFQPQHANPTSDRRAQKYKVTGLAQCLRFLGQVKPHRLRQQGMPRLWEGRAIGYEDGRSFFKTIVAITPLPEQDLVDIETTTGTFIAEGLVSHNSHFAAALDAYLNAELVEKVFLPWDERPTRYGPPALQEAAGGLLAVSYKGHGDPSKVNDKFGIAVAHVENDAEGRAHCVFDLLHHFDPADFDGGIIDYEEVDDWIWDNVIKKFYPEEFTFDQYNSTSSIQRLQKKVRNNSLPKRVNIFEKTTTRPYDWTVKENSKAAINLGLVHAPSVVAGASYERAELELRFLQLVNGRVDHPSAGPVQSKDIADAMTECIHVLIGEQVNNFVHADMARMGPVGVAQEGFTPFEGAMDRAELDVMRGMSGFGRARGMRDSPRDRLTRGRDRRSRS